MVLYQQQMYYQNLLAAFAKDPTSLSKEQISQLLSNPVIKKLIQHARSTSGNEKADYYIPITSLVGQSSVNVIVIKKTDGASEEDRDTTSESLTEESRTGFYTKTERANRIKIYKAKLQRWREARKNPKYVNRSRIAKTKLRVKGRFVKSEEPSYSEDFTSLIKKPIVQKDEDTDSESHHAEPS